MFDLRIIYIGFLSFLATSCFSQEDTDIIVKNETYRYHNEYGEIEITALSDSTWEVSITNNEGQEFVASMKELNNQSFKEIRTEDEDRFLKYSLGGISMSKSKLRIFEFGGYAKLAAECGIKELYTRDFYHKTSSATVAGDLIYTKGGATIDGFYFQKKPKLKEGYYIAKGVFNKEPYPKGYYSTDESPQGMFPDDGKIRYRLIFVDYQLIKPESKSYKGYPVNLSTGEAGLAWEFADSEAFILEGHAPWKQAELEKQITVKGYLLQNHKGSFLKNWEIIN